jgi:hypothetical protein
MVLDLLASDPSWSSLIPNHPKDPENSDMTLFPSLFGHSSGELTLLVNTPLFASFPTITLPDNDDNPFSNNNSWFSKDPLQTVLVHPPR